MLAQRIFSIGGLLMMLVKKRAWLNIVPDKSNIKIIFVAETKFSLKFFLLSLKKEKNNSPAKIGPMVRKNNIKKLPMPNFKKNMKLLVMYDLNC